MPKRHRPPTKRRKAKRPPAPNIPLSTVSQQEAPAPSTAFTNVSPAAPAREHAPEARHLARDYRYVWDEIWRIGLLAAILFGSLVITAVFLRWS